MSAIIPSTYAPRLSGFYRFCFDSVFPVNAIAFANAHFAPALHAFQLAFVHMLVVLFVLLSLKKRTADKITAQMRETTKIQCKTYILCTQRAQHAMSVASAIHDMFVCFTLVCTEIY